MLTIEQAIELAVSLHRGQTDKAGLPYILHPLRVMSSFLEPADHDARTVAVLHDVVEDCDITCEGLTQRGFSSPVVEAIDALSRRKGESEDYTAYIQRVSLNPLALRVKLADLADNLNEARPGTALFPELKERYRTAQKFLLFVRNY